MAQPMVALGNAAICQPCLKQGMGITKVVVDHTMGEVTCTGCGLVLQSGLIDEGQEWRNFASEGVSFGGQTNERVRGGDGDGFDLCGELSSTSFTGGREDKVLQSAQMKVDSMVSLASSDRGLKVALTKVKSIGDELRLSEAIVQRCIGFAKFLSEKNVLGQSHQVAWYYGLIYLGCKEEPYCGRTTQELAHSAAMSSDRDVDVIARQMMKAISQLRKALGSQLRQTHSFCINPEELTPRFVSKLQMSNHVSKAAAHIAKEAVRLTKQKLISSWSAGTGSEQEQSAVIMAAISIVAHLLNLPEKPRLADLSSVAKIPQNVIVDAYEKLKPHINLLLPKELGNSSFESLPDTIRPPAARQPVVPAKNGGVVGSTK